MSRYISTEQIALIEHLCKFYPAHKVAEVVGRSDKGVYALRKRGFRPAWEGKIRPIPSDFHENAVLPIVELMKRYSAGTSTVMRWKKLYALHGLSTVSPHDENPEAVGSSVNAAKLSTK